MAHCRAIESSKAQPLFVDPFAERMAGSYGPWFFSSLVSSSGLEGHSLVKYFATRTKFLDDLVLRTVSGGLTQVEMHAIRLNHRHELR